MMCVCACCVCYWVLGESTLFRFRCIGHSWCIVGPAGRWWEEQRRRRSVGPDGDADRTPTVADAVTAGCAYAELSKAGRRRPRRSHLASLLDRIGLIWVDVVILLVQGL